MKFLLSLLASLLLIGCAQANAPEATATPGAQTASATSPAHAASVVAKALAGSGIQINGELKAPAGYYGFVGNYQGRQLPVYLMPDGQHISIGTLLDIQGNDLTSPAMRAAASSRFGEADWQALAKADAIVEGNPKAKRIVYTFMDTRCPFCHQFWKASQRYLGDDVQIRNIVVAVISPASLPEGAALYDAADPAAAWAKTERNFGHNAKPDPDAGSAAARLKITANNALMRQMGFYGTPAIIYKDAQGKVHAVNGMPQTEAEMDAIFGVGD